MTIVVLPTCLAPLKMSGLCRSSCFHASNLLNILRLNIPYLFEFMGKDTSFLSQISGKSYKFLLQIMGNMASVLLQIMGNRASVFVA